MKTVLLRRAVMLSGLLGLVATYVDAQGKRQFGGVPTTWNPPVGSGISNPYSSNPNSNDDGNNNNDGDDSGNGGGGSNGGDSGGGDGSGSNGDSGGNGSGYFGPGSGSGNGNGGGNNPGNNGGYAPSSPINDYIDMYGLMTTLPAAHGALAAIAFGFLFPLGSILMRVVPGRAALFVHGFVQLFSYATYIAGAGLGLYLVSIVHFPPENKSLLDMASTNAHPIIGIALLVALFIQPVLGVAHHRRFKRLKRRTWVSYAHLWTGRLGITLGIINGGLGFALARTQGPAVIAYAVIAGTMWVLWVLIVLLRKFRTGPRAEQREKIAEEGDREAYVPGVRGGGGSSSSRSGSRSPPAPAIVPAAEPDLPPYEPGPDYAAHTAHLRQTASRDSRGSKDDWEGHGSSRRDEDPGPIQSATDDEMGRGQV